jgi:glycosyltransferase involved in cell wall biosynthesis
MDTVATHLGPGESHGDETAVLLPTVVMVIPAYNSERQVRKALDSALRQDYPNLRILTLDDHSTDGTWMVLQEYAQRVEVVRNESNLGFAQNLNKGLYLAGSADLLFVHQDDVCLVQPDYVARAARYFGDPRIAAVCGQAEHSFHQPFLKRAMTRLLNNDARDEQITETSYSLLKADMLRVSALHEVGGFDFALTRSLGLEDQVLASRLRAAGFRMLKDPSLSYHLDYARTDSLWSFFIKEADAGRNLGHALVFGLIDPGPTLSKETSIKRNYRLSQVAFAGATGLSVLWLLYAPLSGAVALGSVLALRILIHLVRARGFSPRERLLYTAAAVVHDLFFSAGWALGAGVGLLKRLSVWRQSARRQR